MDPSALPVARAADPAVVAAEIAAIESVVSYLRATVLPEPADAPPTDWYPCDELLADPEGLRALMDATATGRGSDLPQVSASLFAQSYAFRVASVAVAGWVLGRPVIAPDPGHTAIAITRSRPGKLAVRNPQMLEGDDDEVLAALVDRLVVGHLAPFVDAIRVTTTIGARLLWGDLVAAIVAVMRAVEGEVDVDRKPSVRERADRFLAAADQTVDGGLADLGAFVILRQGPAEGWFWERTSCCLWYRTSDAAPTTAIGRPQYCGDCSLLDEDDRRAAFVASMGTAT